MSDLARKAGRVRAQFRRGGRPLRVYVEEGFADLRTSTSDGRRAAADLSVEILANFEERLVALERRG